MKNMIKVFEYVEYVIFLSGLCVIMFKEYFYFFKGDIVWYEFVVKFVDKMYELIDFIVNVLKVEDVGVSLNGKVIYYFFCYMMCLLKVKKEFFILLNNVKGFEMENFENSYNCCGFGGMFLVKMG